MAAARDRRRVHDDVRTDLVEYVVIAAPDRAELSGLVPALAALVDEARIRILDLVVVARDQSGVVHVDEVEDVESLVALGHVDGEIGGLLTATDARTAAGALEPGDVGLVVVSEQRWALPLAEAAQRVGGRIVAGERISRDRVEAALREDGEDT